MAMSCRLMQYSASASTRVPAPDPLTVTRMSPGRHISVGLVVNFVCLNVTIWEIGRARKVWKAYTMDIAVPSHNMMAS